MPTDIPNPNARAPAPMASLLLVILLAFYALCLLAMLLVSSPLASDTMAFAAP